MKQRAAKASFRLLVLPALLLVAHLSSSDGGKASTSARAENRAMAQLVSRQHKRYGTIFAAQKRIRELEAAVANLTNQLLGLNHTAGTTPTGGAGSRFPGAVGGGAGQMSVAAKICGSPSRAELRFQCDDYEICSKQCEETFEMKRRIKQDPYVVPMDGSSYATAGKSCREIKRGLPSKAGDGKYWLLEPTTNKPFEGFCDMSTEGGGWTRFGSIAEPKKDLAICDQPPAAPFVEKGMFQFSRAMIMSHDTQKRVLVKETVAPYRQHMYDFGDICPGPEDFLAMITGDRGGDVKVWDWTESKWVANGEGRCNSDGHTQWNCSPKSGVRFHYPTRPFVQPAGGECHDKEWDWFTGYSPRFGDLAKLVKNWDGQYNKSPHDFYFR